MDSLDPFAQKKKQPISTQSPSLNQLSQTPLNQLSSSSSNYNNNSTPVLSTHDLDMFIKPSPQYNNNNNTNNNNYFSTTTTTTSSFDPFFDSKTTFSNNSFDPFQTTPVIKQPQVNSFQNSFDPFAPSVSNVPRPPPLQLQQQQQQQQPQQQQPTFTSFDPFAPSFPQSQSQPQPQPTSNINTSTSTSLFDADFGAFGQTQFEPPKKTANDVEVIELDWSAPPPKLESSRSGSDVEDALQKLRSAYGLTDTIELDDNLDGSDHDHHDKDLDWPGSPRVPIPRPTIPAPVIGKPVAGRYSHSGATHSPYPTGDDRNVVSVDDLNLPTEGSLLARLSVRSLVTKDWQPIFWVLSTDHHRRPLHIDEDPLSLLIYRSKEDYEGYPLGTMIKKEIPIRMNLSCIPIRRKEYKGYGMLHYFMLEENTEMGTVPVIKFASSNRNDVDVLWINLKARINASRKKAVKSLVDSRSR